jgi:hypothetical protein
VTPAEILIHLRTFTAREKIPIPPASIDAPEIDLYPPLGKYLGELANDSKPERVSSKTTQSFWRR